MILQHPQEARNPLSTAKLLSRSLPGAVHRVGLSWPSLRKAMGRDVQPGEWAVLFLGSLKERKKRDLTRAVEFVDRQGKSVPFQPRGIVVLDGTWKQAKTLWWRNPWLLRLRRAVLNPEVPSAYGTVRRQPRRECLSTIEAAAMIFESLGEPAEAVRSLHRLRDIALEAALVEVPVQRRSRTAASAADTTERTVSSNEPEIRTPAE